MPKSILNNKKEGKMNKFLKLLEWDNLGNTPYFPHGITAAIVKDLTQTKGIQVEEDEHAIYVKLGKSDQGNLIVIETHLDHPGYVINRMGKVVGVGSLYESKMVKELNLNRSQPVSFYTPEGQYLSDGEMVNIKAKGRSLTATAKTSDGKRLPMNTQVLPSVKTGLFGDMLHLRSVDNLATTCVCLELIKSLSQHQNNLNVTFIFSKLEEVFQITATGIAVQGGTPFDNFDSNTSFIVLEAAPVCNGKVEDGAKLALAKTENKISLDPETNNLVQSSLLQTANGTDIKIELVNLNSHSDTIAYQLVGKYRNASCLLLNSKNRHNIDDSGDFVAEQVNQKSIEQMIQLLEKVIPNISQTVIKNKTEPKKLTNKENEKRKQLIKSYRWAQMRIRFEKLYPTNMTEFIAFGLSTLISKLDPK